MAVDISTIVGDDNMRPEAKEKAIQIFHDLVQPATVKRYLYARWARVVGLVPSREDLNRVAIWADGE